MFALILQTKFIFFFTQTVGSATVGKNPEHEDILHLPLKWSMDCDGYVSTFFLVFEN